MTDLIRHVYVGYYWMAVILFLTLFLSSTAVTITILKQANIKMRMLIKKANKLESQASHNSLFA